MARPELYDDWFRRWLEENGLKLGTYKEHGHGGHDYFECTLDISRLRAGIGEMIVLAESGRLAQMRDNPPKIVRAPTGDLDPDVLGMAIEFYDRMGGVISRLIVGENCTYVIPHSDEMTVPSTFRIIAIRKETPDDGNREESPEASRS